MPINLGRFQSKECKEKKCELKFERGSIFVDEEDVDKVCNCQPKTNRNIQIGDQDPKEVRRNFSETLRRLKIK